MISEPATAAADGLAVERLGRGDERALAELYDRYAKVAFAVALRVTRDASLAEDAVQEAFLAVWRNSAGYSFAAGSAKTWLLAIVRHRAIDIVRRRRPGVEMGLPEAVQPAAAPGDAWVTADVWPAVQHRLETTEIQAAVGSLPALQRQAIEFAYFRGYTQAEIAIATGAPLGTVKSRVRGALMALRRELDASAAPARQRRGARGRPARAA